MTEKPFVKVCWQDACDLHETWVEAEAAQKFGEELAEVVSWGWLISKTPKYVTLAADFIPDSGAWGRVTKIPTKMCQTIEEFKQD